MKSNSKKIIKITGSVILIVAIVFVFLGIWLYRGPMTDAKIRTFNFLPLPMALVNGRPVPVSQFIFRYRLAQTMLGQDFPAQPVGTTSEDITNQIITEQKTVILAAQENINVSSEQLENEYTAQSENTENFNQSLQSYGLSPETYKNQVIKPQLLLINLQTWFYSQENLNTAAYARANNLIAQIQSGQDMGSLAASTTEDETGKDTQGDLGFVDISEILPELRPAVSAMKQGDIKLIPSRYGLNVIKLEGKNGSQVHLRQIFIQGNSFKIWYNNETKGYSIVMLIKT